MGDLTIFFPVRKRGGEDSSPSVCGEKKVYIALRFVNYAYMTSSQDRLGLFILKSRKKLLAGMAVLEVVENVLQRAAVFRAHCRV